MTGIQAYIEADGMPKKQKPIKSCLNCNNEHFCWFAKNVKNSHIELRRVAKSAGALCYGYNIRQDWQMSGHCCDCGHHIKQGHTICIACDEDNIKIIKGKSK